MDLRTYLFCRQWIARSTNDQLRGFFYFKVMQTFPSSFEKSIFNYLSHSKFNAGSNVEKEKRLDRRTECRIKLHQLCSTRSVIQRFVQSQIAAPVSGHWIMIVNSWSSWGDLTHIDSVSHKPVRRSFIFTY